MLDRFSRVAGDDLVDPARVAAGIKIDESLVLLDDRVLPDRRGGDVIRLLPSAINAFGARR